MKVNFTPSQNNQKTTFQSRNAEIRFADDILRRVNQEFPRFSTTKLYENCPNKKNITKSQANCLIRMHNKLEDLRNIRPHYKLQPLEYLKQVIYTAKVLKLGNCGESATLGKAGFSINGIEGKKVGLFGYNNKNEIVCNFDHSLFIVNLAKDFDLTNPKSYGKKAYIVDVWGEKVDYVPTAMKKLKMKCSDKVQKLITNGYNIKKDGLKFGFKLEDFEMDENTVKLVKKAFPKLKLGD